MLDLLRLKRFNLGNRGRFKSYFFCCITISLLLFTRLLSHNTTLLSARNVLKHIPTTFVCETHYLTALHLTVLNYKKARVSPQKLLVWFESVIYGNIQKQIWETPQPSAEYRPAVYSWIQCGNTLVNLGFELDNL